LIGTRRGNNQLNIFFNLQRTNGQNTLSQKIRGLDGNLKYDIDEILDEQILFYSNQFSTEGWDTIKEDLFEVLLDIFDKFEIWDSQFRGMLTLLHKGDAGWGWGEVEITYVTGVQ
jgi:hypothetical protein